ncbi:hypothetical protein V8B97DRAFT_2012368 [Scleroderma yunnanense]
MTSLTCCQGTRTTVKAKRTTGVGVKTVRRHPAKIPMKLLTSCGSNKITVGVKTMRKHQAGPFLKSLTLC